MLGLELIVVLGAALLTCRVGAARIGVARPVLLLACGVLAGFVPALRSVQLPPETVLLIFLPALLYWESLTTSRREIRANLRAILLLSTGLVPATASTASSGYFISASFSVRGTRPAESLGSGSVSWVWRGTT